MTLEVGDVAICIYNSECINLEFLEDLESVTAERLSRAAKNRGLLTSSFYRERCIVVELLDSIRLVEFSCGSRITFCADYLEPVPALQLLAETLEG